MDAQGFLELRWVSNSRLEWYIDRRIRRQTWKKGWWQQSTQDCYFAEKALHFKHVPFTNKLSGDTLRMEDILISGFQLRKDCRLSAEVAEKAIKIWRLISTAEISSKPWTYEVDAGKPGQKSPMVHCGYELPDFLCIYLDQPR